MNLRGHSPSARPGSTATGLLARGLAARHLVEGLLLLRADASTAGRCGTAVECVHIASMAAWRPSDPDRRSFAWRGSALSAGFLSVHALAAGAART